MHVVFNNLKGLISFRHAPVVQWMAIQLMMILEIILDLKSKQCNITTAFLHSDFIPGEKIFVKMPMGFEKKVKELKLKKTFYRL